MPLPRSLCFRKWRVCPGVREEDPPDGTLLGPWVGGRRGHWGQVCAGDLLAVPPRCPAGPPT